MLRRKLSFAIADLGSTLSIALACGSLMPLIQLLIAAGVCLVDATLCYLPPGMRDKWNE